MNKVLLEDLEYIKNYIDVNAFKQKKIFVTGATGLIGSLILKALNYINEQLNLDIKLIAGVRSLEKVKAIFSEKELNSINWLICDFLKEKINLPEDVNYIIHAAAITKSSDMVKRPVDVIEMTLKSMNQILEYMLQNRQCKMIYISSMEMYGTINKPTVSEDDLGYLNLFDSRTSYPESKRMAELMCYSYVKQYSIDVVVARLSQTFGAGILPGENRVFAQFAKSVLKGENIVLHTDGLSEGNYVYTRDAILAILLLLYKGKSGESYNVVNEESHRTIKAMAEELLATWGSKDTKVIVRIPKNISQLGYASNVKLKLNGSKLMNLGWKPSVDLMDSYYRMMEYMKDELY